MNDVLMPPSIWTTGSTEGVKTGTWRAALARHIQAPSPCHAACPVGGDIAQWIGQARARDFHGAWRTLVQRNPFPAVSGRICHHPCESACNRAGFDEALAICKLERFVGDLALQQGWALEPLAAPRDERVAIVGGGPAGLSAAYQLRRRGYAVTLVEAQPHLGGLLSDGIPPYRLPREVLQAEVARVVAMGITVRLGQPMDSAQALAALRSEHDAVVLACGARQPKALPQLDARQPWVMDGADYLARCSRGQAPALGRRVVVIGGGSAALDVARSARRAGHAVTVLALEAEGRWPAQTEEVIEAQEEGITLIGSAMLCSVHEQGDAGLQLACTRVHFAPGAQRGQFSATPLPDAGFTLQADAVLPSIGQDPDLGALDAQFRRDGAVLHIDRHGATSAPGVWASGDVASRARFVTVAIGMGQRAALAIDRHFNQRRRHDDFAPVDTRPLVPLKAINLHYHPTRPRVADGRLPVHERLAPTDAPPREVQLGLDIAPALAEAARCFSCGTCTHCDNCVTYCPDLAVQPSGGGYTVLTDYCKGCGLCVKECPTGSMQMQEELR